jgi:Tfp pilus assembly protein PilW
MTPYGSGFSAPRRRGLGWGEIFSTLTISLFLLAAVAAAYHASTDAVEINDRFYRATQAGRVTVNQLLTEIRRAESVICATTHDSILVIRPRATRLPDEDSREYRYNPVTRKITLQIYFKAADGACWSSPAYSLASNLQSATFGPPGHDKVANGVWLEARVPITLDVKIGTHSIRLSGTSSARPVVPD